jgi:2-polyprenyl-3-methyl-5-hydroxy-6-metoxy-1,4-benzoquinol methylase
MTCYLCNLSNFRERKGAVRDDPSLRILECTACGLVRLSSFQHIHAGHYANSGMHGGTPPPMHSWLRECEQDDQRRIDMLESALVNKVVLDFGAGAGGFVRKAQSVASSVAGVEPERRVREHWGEAATLYESLENAGSGYDLITAFHVIEHLPDPRTTLRELGARLKSGGRLVVEVPNSEDVLLTLYENDAFQRFTYWSQHLYLFNVANLRSLATQAGLAAVSIQQYQRYPLSNHLYWLSRNRPGGHQQWPFLDTPALRQAYSASLAALGKCDTLIAYLEKE